MTTRRARSGGTLLAVLLTIIVLSAMGAALAQRSLAHVETARTLARADAARGAADAALVAAWQGWDGARHALDSVGAVTTAVQSADSAVVELRVFHGDARLWWITTTAWASGGAGARLIARSSALAVWSRVTAPVPQAAVTGAGTVALGAGARLLADGATPPGWSCPGDTGRDAVVLQPAGSVSAPSGTIVGPVRIAGGPGPDVAALWAADAPGLAILADVVLPTDTLLTVAPGLSDSTCASVGWGEPDRSNASAVCQRRFAVVHARMGLTLRGRGQGVLVADGPLVLDDGAFFAGLVVARGNVRLRGTARLIGGLLMAGGTLTLDDSARVDGVSCVRSAVLQAGALLTEVPAQAWYTLR